MFLGRLARVLSLGWLLQLQPALTAQGLSGLRVRLGGKGVHKVYFIFSQRPVIYIKFQLDAYTAKKGRVLSVGFFIVVAQRSCARFCCQRRSRRCRRCCHVKIAQVALLLLTIASH